MALSKSKHDPKEDNAGASALAALHFYNGMKEALRLPKVSAGRLATYQEALSKELAPKSFLGGVMGSLLPGGDDAGVMLADE